jgi:hypothetical protein
MRQMVPQAELIGVLANPARAKTAKALGLTIPDKVMALNASSSHFDPTRT